MKHGSKDEHLPLAWRLWWLQATKSLRRFVVWPKNETQSMWLPLSSTGFCEPTQIAHALVATLITLVSPELSKTYTYFLKWPLRRSAWYPILLSYIRVLADLVPCFSCSVYHWGSAHHFLDSAEQLRSKMTINCTSNRILWNIIEGRI
jgi:hypothetical protein